MSMVMISAPKAFFSSSFLSVNCSAPQFLLLGVLLLLRHLLQEWCCLVAYSHIVRLHSWIWDVRMKAEIRAWSQAKMLTGSCKAHVPQNVTQWAAVAHLL